MNNANTTVEWEPSFDNTFLESGSEGVINSDVEEGANTDPMSSDVVSVEKSTLGSLLSIFTEE